MQIDSCDACSVKLQVVDSTINKWNCPKCLDIYWRCSLCEEKGEFIFDWDENDKGIRCSRCEEHFCISCWQNSGKLFSNMDSDDEMPSDIEDGGYICDNCLKEEN